MPVSEVESAREAATHLTDNALAERLDSIRMHPKTWTLMDRNVLLGEAADRLRARALERAGGRRA